MANFPDDLLCLVISLKRAEERRAAITSKLAELGIPFHFIDGIDAREVDVLSHPEVDPAGAEAKMGRPLVPGEFGCALAHIAAMRAFVDSGAAYVLILEDDAILDSKLRRYIDGGHYRKAPMTLLCHLEARVRKGRSVPLFAEFALMKPVNSPFMAAAYVLDRPTCQRLLDAAVPVRSVADWPLDISRLGARITLPMIVTHPPPNDPAQSLIGQRNYQSLRERLGRRRYFAAAYWHRKWLRATTERVS